MRVLGLMTALVGFCTFVGAANAQDWKAMLEKKTFTDKDGKTLLSWRVDILPFIEQDTLYKEFHLDEPWDSEHNKKLLAKMPKVFRAPGSKASGAAARSDRPPAPV